MAGSNSLPRAGGSLERSQKQSRGGVAFKTIQSIRSDYASGGTVEHFETL